MRRRWFGCLLMVQSLFGMGQGFDIDLFAGISNYQGDLQPIVFTVQNSNPGAAIILKYGFGKRFYFRSGFTFGSVAASDANNREDLRPRNLSFRSGIQELTAGFEYRFIDPDRFRVTPYIFAGAGVFRFNPYAYGDGYEGRVYLQPLSTEGQGLQSYPDRTPYKLTQFCIPYGLGIKWQVNCNLNLGVEFRQTKLFTDYLDDVSTTYVDQAALLQARGQKAVDFAWRGDEFNGAPYPSTSSKRGNPGENDWYYFAGLTLGLKLQDCETGSFSLGGLFNRNRNQRPRAKIDCPRVW